MIKFVLWIYMTVAGVPQWVPSPIDYWSMKACAEAQRQHKENIILSTQPTACVIEGHNPNDAKEP